MQTIHTELSSSIINIQYKLEVLVKQRKYIFSLIKQYNKYVLDIQNILAEVNINIDYKLQLQLQFIFTFPSFAQYLKHSDKRALQQYLSSSLISIDSLNKIKLDERSKLHERITAAIAHKKLNKLALANTLKRLDYIRASIAQQKYSIKHARVTKLKLLIKQNESLGCDKLNPIYNLLENDGVKLEASVTLYFDSSSIKSMIKQLDELVESETSLMKELDYIKWHNNGDNDNASNASSVTNEVGRIGFPIIYSSKEDLAAFEAIILRGYKNKLEGITLKELKSEFENCKIEESQLECELSALKDKLAHLRYLPECRRIQAYEKMLSLTASSTIPGASTV
jgi:hypothetical protein